MDNGVQRDCFSVLDAKTRDDLRAAVARFSQQLGFQIFSAVTVIDRVLDEPEFIGVDNTPPGFLATFDDLSISKRDPVMQHCRTRGVPIVWDRETYAKAGAIDKWELQAPHGYRCGIALAMHLPGGRHFVLGVDRDQDLPSDAEEVTRMVASLQLFAAYAHEAALPILSPAEVQADRALPFDGPKSFSQWQTRLPCF